VKNAIISAPYRNPRVTLFTPAETLRRLLGQVRYHSGAMESVPTEELIRRVRSGAVTVLDVRPSEEYHAGHIPGALSVPLAELKQRLAHLPRNREIVAYCRGPYCVLAIEAVALLRTEGFRARRLQEGVPEWQARGWRIASGAARPVPKSARKRSHG